MAQCQCLMSCTKCRDMNFVHTTVSLPGDAEELLFLQAVCVCVCCVVAAFLASQFSSHACSSIWQPEMPFFIYPASPVLVSRQSGGAVAPPVTSRSNHAHASSLPLLCWKSELPNELILEGVLIDSHTR